MIRLGFALGCSLLLVAVVSSWAPGRRGPVKLPERAALEREAREHLTELREVASTWLEPSASRPETRTSEALPAPAPEPEEQPAERVTAHAHELADAAPSEWSGVAEPSAPTDHESDLAQFEAAPALGRFSASDLDESEGIVRRLLAVYARVERAP